LNISSNIFTLRDSYSISNKKDSFDATFKTLPNTIFLGRTLNIIAQKKRFIKAATGDSKINGKRVAVFGKRRPFLRGKYGVFVDGEKKKRGSLAEVFMYLKGGEFKEGLGILREVVNEVDTPKRSIVGKNGIVGKFEASIIKLFGESSVMSNIRLIEITESDKEKIDGVLMNLQTRGFLRIVGRKENGSGMVQSYSLTDAGEVLQKMLV